MRALLVQMLHNGGSRHVQRYVPDEVLVKKSVMGRDRYLKCGEKECISYVVSKH